MPFCLSSKKTRKLGSVLSFIVRRSQQIILGFAVFLTLSTIASSQELKVNEKDLVHFGDIIDVDVVGSFEFDWRGKLNSEGFLDGLNTYGDPVYGLCHSDSDIAATVTLALAKMLRDPQVIVKVLDRSQRAVVTLDGAVRTPQRFQLRRDATVRELLIMSGGVNDDASGEIQLFRQPHFNCYDIRKSDLNTTSQEPAPAADVLPITTIKISDLLKGKLDADPLVRSGDLITVMRAVPIYVIGGVNDPKPILSHPGLSLTRAIAMAGGLAKESDRGLVTIYRRDGNSSVVIEADLEKISVKPADDPLLKPLDIVEVSQRNRAKRKFAPIVENNRTSKPVTLPLRIVE